MTPALADQLAALQTCCARLHALGCSVTRFTAWHCDAQPIVAIVRPTRALADWLDTQQVRVGVGFSSCWATIDGCAVSWPLAEWVRIEDAEEAFD